MEEQKLKELLQKHLKVNLNEVPLATNIKDLNIDSLDFMEILMDVEDEYGITFSNDELLSIKTLDDLFAILRSKLS